MTRFTWSGCPHDFGVTCSAAAISVALAVQGRYTHSTAALSA